MCASGRRREERWKPPQRGEHIPRPSAVITGSAHLAGAGTSAHRAILGPGNLQLGAPPTQLLVECNAHAATHIRRPSNVWFPLWRRSRPLGGGGRALGTQRGVAIVLGAAGRIAQNVVGGTNKLERLLGIGAAIAVWMPQHCTLTIRAPDFLR